MSNAVVRVASFGCLIILIGLAIAQKRPEPKVPTRSSNPAEDGKVASVEEPDFTRFRVTTDQGTLVVFDAEEDWDGREEPASQLAYWNDFASEQLFFFDRLLFTSDDVLQSVAAMQRDLDIDSAQLLSERPELDPLPEPDGTGIWRPATEDAVLSVMTGQQPGAVDSGEVSGVILPCVPNDLCDPQALATTGPIPGPVRGTPNTELFVMAQSGTKCNCVGGGGCYCNDGLLCTIDTCENGSCVFTQKICPDPDSCTTGQCLWNTGQCRTDSYCGDGPCCTGQLNNWCCPEGEICCEFHPPYACCPPQLPACCGTACCASEIDCCNGHCKDPDEACPLLCCSYGWETAPTCVPAGCADFQALCNGECCGESRCKPGSCVDNQCVIENACDDDDPCTQDWCSLAQCQTITCDNVPSSGGACEDDGDNCTLNICSNGQCTHPPKCPNQTCCTDGHCCGDGLTCCGELCCTSGQTCCGEVCTSPECCIDGRSCCDDPSPCCNVPDPCCDPECPSGETCCGRQCCPDDRTCCDGECCQNSTYCGQPLAAICCNDACCLGECCNDVCCSPSESCTSCGCCAGTCCNGSCCNGTCFDGTLCCDDGNPCTLDSAICGDELCTFRVCTFPPLCDDSNPCTDNNCTFDGCGQTTCNFPNKEDCTACPDGSCINGSCVLIVDLDFEGVADDKEETPGAFVSTWDEEGELLPGLTLNAGPGLTGSVTIEVMGNKGGIQLYHDAQGTNVVGLFNQTIPIAELPKTFYVRGFVVSGAARDIEFKLIHNGPEMECEDLVKLTVLELKLKSLTFTTDHDLLRDNLFDYEPTGDVFQEPKWEAGRQPYEDFPISHTMGQNVGIDAKIELLPSGSNPPEFALSTQGPPGFNFNNEVTLPGGESVLTLTSVDQLEEKIQSLEGSVEWTVRHNDRVLLRKVAGPYRTFVTIGTPRDPTVDEHVVTWNRMARTVFFAGIADSLNPHAIVQELVWSVGPYDVRLPRDNAWEVPDEVPGIGSGGDCQSIVRFGINIAKMIDLPGEYEHTNIYAIETDPGVAIEGSPYDGLGDRWHPIQPWRLFLLDYSGACNNFEAAIKFTCSKQPRYFPGGTWGAVLDNKDAVLGVFDTLSWTSFPCILEEVVHSYSPAVYTPVPPPCP